MSRIWCSPSPKRPRSDPQNRSVPTKSGTPSSPRSREELSSTELLEALDRLFPKHYIWHGSSSDPLGLPLKRG